MHYNTLSDMQCSLLAACTPHKPSHTAPPSRQPAPLSPLARGRCQAHVDKRAPNWIILACNEQARSRATVRLKAANNRGPGVSSFGQQRQRRRQNKRKPGGDFKHNRDTWIHTANGNSATHLGCSCAQAKDAKVTPATHAAATATMSSHYYVTCWRELPLQTIVIVAVIYNSDSINYNGAGTQQIIDDTTRQLHTTNAIYAQFTHSRYSSPEVPSNNNRNNNNNSNNNNNNNSNSNSNSNSNHFYRNHLLRANSKRPSEQNEHRNKAHKRQQGINERLCLFARRPSDDLCHRKGLPLVACLPGASLPLGSPLAPPLPLILPAWPIETMSAQPSLQLSLQLSVRVSLADRMGADDGRASARRHKRQSSPASNRPIQRRDLNRQVSRLSADRQLTCRSADRQVTCRSADRQVTGRSADSVCQCDSVSCSNKRVKSGESIVSEHCVAGRCTYEHKQPIETRPTNRRPCCSTSTTDATATTTATTTTAATTATTNSATVTKVTKVTKVTNVTSCVNDCHRVTVASGNSNPASAALISADGTLASHHNERAPVLVTCATEARATGARAIGPCAPATDQITLRQQRAGWRVRQPVTQMASLLLLVKLLLFVTTLSSVGDKGALCAITHWEQQQVGPRLSLTPTLDTTSGLVANNQWWIRSRHEQPSYANYRLAVQNDEQRLVSDLQQLAVSGGPNSDQRDTLMMSDYAMVPTNSANEPLLGTGTGTGQLISDSALNFDDDQTIDSMGSHRSQSTTTNNNQPPQPTTTNDQKQQPPMIIAGIELHWATLLLSMVLILIILSTIIGNLFVIVSILIERNLRTVGNYLVLSLAIADLLVACLVMPMGAIYQIMDQWTLGATLCDVWTVADVFSCTASILHLLAIALDRYWAVTRVDYIRCQRSSKRIVYMIFSVWFAALIISMAPTFGWKDDNFEHRLIHEKQCLVSQDIGYQIFATCATFYVPLIFILAYYWKIFQVARKRIRHRPGNKVKISLQHPSSFSTGSSPTTNGTQTTTPIKATSQQHHRHSVSRPTASESPINNDHAINRLAKTNQSDNPSTSNQLLNANRGEENKQKADKLTYSQSNADLEACKDSQPGSKTNAHNVKSDTGDSQKPPIGVSASGDKTRMLQEANIDNDSNNNSSLIDKRHPISSNDDTKYSDDNCDNNNNTKILLANNPVLQSPDLANAATKTNMVNNDNNNSEVNIHSNFIESNQASSLLHNGNCNELEMLNHDDSKRLFSDSTTQLENDDIANSSSLMESVDLTSGGGGTPLIVATNQTGDQKQLRLSVADETTSIDINGDNNNSDKQQARRSSSARSWWLHVQSIFNNNNNNAGILANSNSNSNDSSLRNKKQYYNNSSKTKQQHQQQILRDAGSTESHQTDTNDYSCDYNGDGLDDSDDDDGDDDEDDLDRPIESSSSTGCNASTSLSEPLNRSNQRCQYVNNYVVRDSVVTINGHSNSNNNSVKTQIVAVIDNGNNNNNNNKSESNCAIEQPQSSDDDPRMSVMMVANHQDKTNKIISSLVISDKHDYQHSHGKNSRECLSVENKLDANSDDVGNDLLSGQERPKQQRETSNQTHKEQQPVVVISQASAVGGDRQHHQCPNHKSVNNHRPGHNHHQHLTTKEPHQLPQPESIESKREKKAAKTLAIITGVFVICWLPFFIMAILMPLLNVKPHKYIFALLLWLGYANSMLNPIIYTIFSPDFRVAFQRLLCGKDFAAKRIRRNARKLQELRAKERKKRLSCSPSVCPSHTISISNNNSNSLLPDSPPNSTAAPTNPRQKNQHHHHHHHSHHNHQQNQRFDRLIQPATPTSKQFQNSQSMIHNSNYDYIMPTSISNRAAF